MNFQVCGEYVSEQFSDIGAHFPPCVSSQSVEGISLCPANQITLAFMDIKHLTGEDKLKLSRTYFFAGIGFLPFLWWINVFCFLKELSAPQAYPEYKLIRKCTEIFY
ncbi:unnamed protein product [Schistosoma rodhaini]|uniref:Gamma-secretase subunit PEN-2 n=1 Tax=Schistosoma rodhaini TaxID=6188 RepID=A0AA85F664_9TREM|nr:unnamed protein product [Schistosoma rodhaini]CAH8477005.1 unnamed protein product [Schistosoma rodhaini]